MEPAKTQTGAQALCDRLWEARTDILGATPTPTGVKLAWLLEDAYAMIRGQAAELASRQKVEEKDDTTPEHISGLTGRLMALRFSLITAVQGTGTLLSSDLLSRVERVMDDAASLIRSLYADRQQKKAERTDGYSMALAYREIIRDQADILETVKEGLDPYRRLAERIDAALALASTIK
jgi:hypothetical protein